MFVLCNHTHTHVDTQTHPHTHTFSLSLSLSLFLSLSFLHAHICGCHIYMCGGIYIYIYNTSARMIEQDKLFNRCTLNIYIYIYEKVLNGYILNVYAWYINLRVCGLACMIKYKNPLNTYILNEYMCINFFVFHVCVCVCMRESVGVCMSVCLLVCMCVHDQIQETYICIRKLFIHKKLIYIRNVYIYIYIYIYKERESKEEGKHILKEYFHKKYHLWVTFHVLKLCNLK